MIVPACRFYCEAGTYDPASGLWIRPDPLGHGLEESPYKSIPAGMYWALVTRESHMGHVAAVMNPIYYLPTHPHNLELNRRYDQFLLTDYTTV